MVYLGCLECYALEIVYSNFSEVSENRKANLYLIRAKPYFRPVILRFLTSWAQQVSPQQSAPSSPEYGPVQ